MKIIKGLINVLTTLIIVVGIVFVGLYIAGIKPYVVLSGSMEPKLQTGSLCFINKRIKYDKLKEEDIIAFRNDNDTLVTHRLVSISPEEFETKGDANNTTDGVFKKERYVGKNIFWIPKVGYVIRIVQTTRGKLVFGTFIILLFAAGILLGENRKKPVVDKDYTLELSELDILKSKKK